MEELLMAGGGLVPATWNPADKAAQISLSNGDLTATHTSQAIWAAVRATVGKSSDTGSFEITYDSGAAAHLLIVGMAIATWPINGSAFTTTDKAYNLHDNATIIKSHSGGPTVLASSLTALTPGDVFRMEVNFNTLQFEMFNNNVSQGGLLAFDADTYFPCFYGYRTRVVTLNCGQSAFVNSPTAGITEGWG